MSAGIQGVSEAAVKTRGGTSVTDISLSVLADSVSLRTVGVIIVTSRDTRD